MESIGLYAQYYFIPAEKPYKINTGLRYDFNRVYTQFEPDNIFEWPDFFYQGVNNTNQSLNWSTGLHYDLPSNFKIRLLAGSSFRAPNVDDIAKIRLKSDEISIPNPMLTPEKSINGEATISYKSKTTEIGLTGFYTRLSDAIVRQNYTLPNGDSEYITNGDTFQIVANINAENAIIQGISFNAKHQISSTLLLRAGVSFTKGDIVSEGVSVEPLAHIPPTYGNVSLQYNRKRLLTNLGFRYNGNKALDRFGGSTDNPEFATPEGSLSWYTLHMNVRYKIYESLQLQLGVDNILDQFYVPFASGVPGAGRHVSLTLRGSF